MIVFFVLLVVVQMYVLACVVVFRCVEKISQVSHHHVFGSAHLKSEREMNADERNMCCMYRPKHVVQVQNSTQ